MNDGVPQRLEVRWPCPPASTKAIARTTATATATTGPQVRVAGQGPCGPNWPAAISMLVLVGLLTGACTSSPSSAASSSPVTTAPTPSAGTAYGATADIETGAIT